MDERDVREALRDLPRERASAGFPARVRRRIRGVRRRRPGGVLVPVAAAAAALAFAGALRLDALRRERALRRETRDLAREIEALKRSLPPSVIELGEEDGIQYALDARRPPAPRRGVL